MPAHPPSIEEVTVALVARLQEALGARATALGAADRVAIEVVVPETGELVEEEQNRPKVKVIGPREMPRVAASRKPRMRILTEKDTEALTYKTRPLPRRYNLTFDILGQAVRQSTEDAAELAEGETPVDGEFWLREAIVGALDDIRLLEEEWTVYIDGWPGYFVEWLSPPRQLAGAEASLYVIQGTVQVRDYRLFTGAEESGKLVRDVVLEAEVNGVKDESSG